MNRLVVPSDVIVIPEAEGRWVVLNVFSRTSLGVDLASLDVLRAAERLEWADLLRDYSNREFQVWEIEWFSNYNGLLADPTRYIRDTSAWPKPEWLKVVELVERFSVHFLLINNEGAYRERFAPKTSILDADHFGNFHQQLAQELILHYREEPAKWWLKQKFTDDLSGLRSNLYSAIQEYNLKNYIKRKFSIDCVVIDIGCGNGFYSNMIADTGARVLGIDPNAEYIQLARKMAHERARFEVADVSCKGAMDFVPDASADFVFMSDALLFYFVPMVPGQMANIKTLFDDIRRILKPGGSFVSIEPHYVFWLLPWLGETERPFTILTEYLHKSFGVTPNVSRIIQTSAENGFAVSWMEEFVPDPAFEKLDARGYHFARQFPLWQLYEFKPTLIQR